MGGDGGLFQGNKEDWLGTALCGLGQKEAPTRPNGLLRGFKDFLPLGAVRFPDVVRLAALVQHITTT